ncbi:MAG: ABC transporter substrate-binding protein, partial [Candidatus Hodarchaeota archaeon]
MKKKICLLILLATLFIPTFTSPIKTQQLEARSQDSKTLSKASPSSIPFIFGTRSTQYSIDPVDCYYLGDENIIDQVAETLFTYNYSDPNLPLIPLLATAVSDISGGGLNYTINLRKNVTFHDGTEFNAIAAKWNFDRMEYWWNFSGALPYTEYIGSPYPLFYFEDGETPIWNHTEIVGEYAIKFVLNAPFVPLLDVLTYTATAMVSPTSHGWDITSPIYPPILPVGTGPFVIDSYIRYKKAKFHAYENYWREIANISKLIFSYYDYYDGNKLSRDLLESKVHFIDLLCQPFLLDDLKSDPNITFLDEGKTDSNPLYLIFNNNHLNQTWREALSYAINYSEIIKVLSFFGEGARLKSPVPEGIRYSNYGFNYPNFNITKAREIMQSMGFGIGWNTTYPGTDEFLWR